MEKVLEQILEKLNNMETEQKEQGKKLSSLDSKVAGLDSKVAGLDNKVTSLDSKVAGLDNKVTSLDSKVTGLDSKVTGLDSKVTGLDSKVTGMETDIKLIKTQQSEQGEILQAVRHAQEVQKAQNDKFEIEIAQLSGKMDQGFNDVVEVQKALLDMYGEHEAEIRIMRKKIV
jgi:chromosome segregation ATPase